MPIAVLASGHGSILEAILDDGIDVGVVVADRTCRALEIAQRASVSAALLERTDFGASFDRDAYTDQVVDTLAKHDTQLVAMAGFLTVLSKQILDAYPGRVLNTHPSLLPAFGGMYGPDVIEETLRTGVKVTGCTVHLVTEDLDAGPIVAQEPVPVLPQDDVTTLHERIKRVERVLYPKTIKELLG